MGSRFLGALAAALVLISHARAATTPKADLALVRKRVLAVEKEVILGLQSEKHTQKQIGKIKELIRLQKQEKEIASRRLAELEKTLTQLESRRSILRERIEEQKDSLRKTVQDLYRSLEEKPDAGGIEEREFAENPRRRLMAYLASNGVKEIEILRVDLEDAERIELKIDEEKQQLAYLLEDLKEQESVLKFNEQLHADLLQKRHAERVSRLAEYRKLKEAESKIEQLIQDFNARLELEKIRKSERESEIKSAPVERAFSSMKGELIPPVQGRVSARFGKSFDSKTSLNLFKKGIEFSVPAASEVKAISSGTVSYSGELPGYGQVVIVDHGDGFYSVSANLSRLSTQKGMSVSAGNVIGMTDAGGKPFYFEIRSRNIPVDPLQWIIN